MPNPELSVVIPTLGRGEKLDRALEHLAAQEGEFDFEVIVVLDAAAEQADAGRAPKRGDVRLERAPRPGASAARNHGWRSAKAPLILFIDDDVLAAPGLVGQHLEWHRKHPDDTVGVLGHLRWADGIKVTPFMRWLENGIQFDYPRIEGTEAGWGRFYTANASVKKSILEKVAGFDEAGFPFGYEDLDLALRMHRHGFQLLYNREAEAEHLHEMSLDFWKERIKRIARAERTFVERHPEQRPYFHDLLQAHILERPPRGWTARLAPVVLPSVPLLGPRVWASVDAVVRHELAPHFMKAWDEAPGTVGASPDLTERHHSR